MLSNYLSIKNLRVLSLIIFIIGLSTSCSKEECFSTDITSSTKSIAELGYCDDAVLNMQLISNDQFSIIRNEEEYDASVEGTCHPDIDFTQVQLIIGHFYSQKELIEF